MRRDTLEYEYNLKASLKQQQMQQEAQLREDQFNRGKQFVTEVFDTAEKEKRETGR